MMNESLSNPEQLTEADLRRLGIIAGLHDDAMVWEDEINTVRKFMPALLACARRDMEQQKRIAELEADNTMLLKRLDAVMDIQRETDSKTVEIVDKVKELEAALQFSRYAHQEHIKEYMEQLNKMSALLDRAPHMVGLDTNDSLVCFMECARCAWERMKGGGK
jgi:hypothetical protein